MNRTVAHALMRAASRLISTHGGTQQKLRGPGVETSLDAARMSACATFLLLAATLSAQTLTGVIDIHVHSDPDSVPRSIDAIDIAKLARSRGMRGLVLKNHYEPTASLAYIVRKEVQGVEIFGGISLDLTVGGVNPAAVEHMTRVKGGCGRVVWMPTFDAEN